MMVGKAVLLELAKEIGYYLLGKYLRRHISPATWKRWSDAEDGSTLHRK